METKDYAETGKTLGILSIFLCWIPIVGLALGFIATSKASSGSKHDPKKAHAADVLAAWGMSLSVLFMIVYGIASYNQYQQYQQYLKDQRCAQLIGGIDNSMCR